MDWIDAETPPNEAKEYLCVLRDGQENRWLDPKDIWREVVEFRWENKYKKTGGFWVLCNFDIVVCWTTIPDIPDVK